MIACSYKSVATRQIREEKDTEADNADWQPPHAAITPKIIQTGTHTHIYTATCRYTYIYNIHTYMHIVVVVASMNKKHDIYISAYNHYMCVRLHGFI